MVPALLEARKKRKGKEERKMVNDRKIGVAKDFSKRSNAAFVWAVDNLADKGDIFYVIHVKSIETSNELWATSGSPLIPLSEFREPGIMREYDITLNEEMLDLLDSVAREKEITIVLKLYWGDPRDKICDAIEHLELDSLVMGGRGASTVKRLILGSVTDYVVTHAPCPVIVVKDPDFKNK